MRRRRSSRYVGVMADVEGVTIVRGDQAHSPGFRWADVAEIRAFKRDLGIVDDIRLAFEAGGLWYECGEDEPGFAGLREAMEDRFRAIPAGWFGGVMQPPFATNETVLFRRDLGS